MARERARKKSFSSYHCWCKKYRDREMTLGNLFADHDPQCAAFHSRSFDLFLSIIQDSGVGSHWQFRHKNPPFGFPRLRGCLRSAGAESRRMSRQGVRHQERRTSRRLQHLPSRIQLQLVIGNQRAFPKLDKTD